MLRWDMYSEIHQLKAVGMKKCENGIERLIEYRNRILKRDERIYKHLKTNAADIHELAEQCLVFRFHPTPFATFYEKMILNKHLERLEEKGLVETVENGRCRAL